MKKIVILMACAGLLAACHRSENRGGAGTESGTYQGTTGSEGWSGSVTNTNTVITPTEPGVSEPGKTGAGGIGGRPETGPSGSSDQDLNKPDQNTKPNDQTPPPSEENTEPETGTDNGSGGPGTDTGTGSNGAGAGGY